MFGKFWSRLGDFFGLHYSPGIVAKIILGLIPFLLVCYFYNAKAEEYHNDPNVSKKVLPYASDMYEAMKKYVT
ncbi:hypothetical protein HQ571_04250, partial [Candidatus Kuenenbacteria bacterium]|nr:hypothetical protein [Candidatus Kuenenbacteria bacterium]